MKPKLKVLLANPRGFCAGVVRAIDIVERALLKYGAPVFVRHEIVHNRFVVRSLEDKGAVFVKEVSDADPDRPIIFSAHGVAKSVPAEAEAKNIHYIDATCPLVSKVHREAERDFDAGRHIILIGHAGHPEVIGTMGQLPEGAVTLVEKVQDVDELSLAQDLQLSFVTQTTLSVDDTADVINALKAKFPGIKAPNSQDICYATTNRQEAVKHLGPMCDLFLVVGAPNSSNSNRLVDVARTAGAAKSLLVQDASELDLELLNGVSRLGISAGASAPEVLVEGLLDKLGEAFTLDIEPVTIREENVRFNIPRELRDLDGAPA